jgi:hypothetical protein
MKTKVQGEAYGVTRMVVKSTSVETEVIVDFTEIVVTWASGWVGINAGLVVSNTARVETDGVNLNVVNMDTVEFNRIVEVGALLSVVIMRPVWVLRGRLLEATNAMEDEWELSTVKMPKLATVLQEALEGFDWALNDDGVKASVLLSQGVVDVAIPCAVDKIEVLELSVELPFVTTLWVDEAVGKTEVSVHAELEDRVFPWALGTMDEDADIRT